MLAYICFYIWYYIICPIKRFWNLFIRHRYILNNIKTQSLISYCEKIIIDPNYIPNGAYENYFEQQLQDYFNKVLQFMKEEDPNFPIEEFQYENERPFCAAHILKNINEFITIEK